MAALHGSCAAGLEPHLPGERSGCGVWVGEKRVGKTNNGNKNVETHLGLLAKRGVFSRDFVVGLAT